jgi:hypothetical protein
MLKAIDSRIATVKQRGHKMGKLLDQVTGGGFWVSFINHVDFFTLLGQENCYVLSREGIKSTFCCIHHVTHLEGLLREEKFLHTLDNMEFRASLNHHCESSLNLIYFCLVCP